jgi:hypothetical protein
LTVAEDTDDDDNDNDFINDGNDADNDDIVNNNNNNIINNDDDDDIVNNNNNDDIHNVMDGIDDNVNEGDNLNQLEEWDQVADDEGNAAHNCGDKRPHSSTVSAIKWRKPVKVHATTGVRPKAGDYEVAVQKILAEAIPLYRGYLSTVTPYPGAMLEIRWAKKTWKDSCEDCETWMIPNDEIIKLVCAHAACQRVALTFPEDHQPGLAFPWLHQNQGSAARQDHVRILYIH